MILKLMQRNIFKACQKGCELVKILKKLIQKNYI